MKSHTTKSSRRRRAAVKDRLVWTVGLFGLFLAQQPCVQAMMASPDPFFETQPNGQVVQLHVHGDTYDSWMTDMDGYTVVRDPSTGSYVYAEEDGNGGLQPSQELVNRHRTNDNDPFIYHPRQLYKNSKRRRHLRPSKRDCRNLICGDYSSKARRRSDGRLRGTQIYERSKTIVDQFVADPLNGVNATRSARNDEDGRKLWSTGTLRNLVILLKWSDHQNRTLPSPDDIDILMNHEGPHTLCPTGSVRDVFLENSYGALSLESTVMDWILMNNTEAYFANVDSGRSTITRQAIKSALGYLDSNDLVDFDYFDADQDGIIDAITFLHSGYGAEFGGTDQFGTFYENRIWSHKWGLYDEPFVSRSGVEVIEYHLSTSLWNRTGVSIGRIGVIAHETGHFLGLPDLYDKDGGGVGVGTFDLMANSWGFDGTQYYPPHMSAWTKLLLGWTIPYFPSPGKNELAASELQDANQPQVYAIKEGFPKGEFLLIENRQRLGLDSTMPQSGIVIYHIDHRSSAEEFYDSLQCEGYPGQEGWPANGNHYGVAVVQADGLFELEQLLNIGDSGDYFHGAGVDHLVPCRDLTNCQHPNTDSYQDGVVARTNVHITDISNSGAVMTFNYRVGEFESTNPSASPSMAPSSHPSSAPLEQPTTCFGPGLRCYAHDHCCSGFCMPRKKRFFGTCY